MTATVLEQPVAARSSSTSRYPIVGVSVFGVLALLAVLAPILPIADPAAQSLGDALQGPSGGHWLGTDELGRDLFARVVFGTRTTLLSAATALAVTAVLGLPLGLLAGYWRGTLDMVASRVADAVMTTPPLVLLLVTVTSFGSGITKSMIVLGLVLSPRLFRVARATTIGLASAGYLEVGRMSGCPTRRMLRRYVLPNVRFQVVVQLSLLLGYAALTEAGLSFLGLGVQPPGASLGVLLKSGVEYMEDAPLLTIAPGLLLTGFILACNLLGDRFAEEVDDV